MATHLLDKEHPDITYLKKDEIGLVLSKGLSETFKVKPKNPVDFFAKWLLNHSKTQKKANEEKEREKVVKELRDKHTYFVKAKHAEQEEAAKDEKAKEDKIKKFYEVIDKSEDLTDNLDELANYLKTFTNATGVYVGKLVYPKKEINDDDDDKAHLDTESSKVIQFIHASDGHNFMEGQLLKSDQGITHDAFKTVEEEQQQDGGEDLPPPEKSDDILKTFNHIYVKEVVREPRMHFFRVPKLGSYMAIPLVFKSCLFEDALDNAVADYLEVTRRREEQEKEKQIWEEDRQRDKEEKERAGEVYEPEYKEWEVIEEKPFDVEEEAYVVCIDTLGQDRELTDDEKRFALNTVNNFKDLWERTENENLLRDRNRKLEIMEIDKEFFDNESAKVMEEEDKYVDEVMGTREDMDTDEIKELYSKDTRIRYIARMFKEKEDWNKNLMQLKDFKVLKYQRILQSLFYLLGYDRKDICEPKSNKFFWKKAKNYLNDEFLDKLSQYRVLGAKDDTYYPFQSLNFIERNVDGINPEDVDTYNLTLGKIYKWMLLAIKTRKEDIVRRKAQKKKAREVREELSNAYQARETKRAQDLIDAEDKFKEEHKEEIEAALKYEEQEQSKKNDDYGDEQEDEEKEQKPKEKPIMPVFNKEEHLIKWEEDNIPVVIPPEVEDDLDKDWVLSEEEEEALVLQYVQARESA